MSYLIENVSFLVSVLPEKKSPVPVSVTVGAAVPADFKEAFVPFVIDIV